MALVDALPAGAALIYRHFGAADRIKVAKALRQATRRRGVLLLISADPRLAAQVKADGVHLPERLARQAAHLKRRRPAWLVTAAAHGPPGLRKAQGADAALLSPVFPTRSASAGPPIGVRRARAWAKAAPMPVFALGGINARNAARLRGVVGIAAIDTFVMS